MGGDTGPLGPRQRAIAAGALRGSAWTAAGMAVSTVATFLANAAVVAVAAPAVFADVVIATIFSMIASVVFRAGIDRMIVAEVHASRAEGSEQDARRVGSSLLAAALVLGAVGALMVVVGPLSWLLDASLSAPLTLLERSLIGLWLASDVVRMVAAEAHRSEQRFRLAALSGYGLRAPLLLLLILAAALLPGEPGRTLVLGCAAFASTVVVVISLAATVRMFPWWSTSPVWALHRTRRGNAAMLLTTLAGALLGGADVWVVGASLDPEQTARYGFAATTVGGLAILSTTVSGGLSPYLARAHSEGDLASLQPLVLRYVRFTSVVVVVLFVLLVGLLEPVAEMLGGSAYDGMTPVVAILAAGQVISTAAGLSGYVLSLARQYSAVAAVTVSVALCAVAGEALAGFLLGQVLLVALAKAGATGLLPIMNDVVAGRLLGVRTHTFARTRKG